LRQIDESDAMVVPFDQPLGHREGDCGFADPARSDDGDETTTQQLRRERPHPVAAVDHARDWRWQIVHARSGGPRRRTWFPRADYRSDKR
jgi:hypothetical protein